ncbi:hypothetical protein HanLR1_Chr01g0021731 [Helianthus annuus]|nr:hypothetical protein HanLR1_Chr01g0021731 [Helianthus annuus]
MCQRGCLLRMKCVDYIFGGQINKTKLPMRYNFLIGLMVALVLNKPFNISKYLFSNMKENMRRTGASGHKFWMYPRFLQMIMSVEHPDLPKAANDVLKIDVMIEHSLKIFKGVVAKRYPEDTPRKMFGALEDKNYITPANDKWRHDESQYDDEKPTLKKMMEDKFGQKKLDIFGDTDDEDDGDGGDDEGGEGGDGGNVGASGISARGGDNADSSENVASSSADITLQACPPVSREELEDGEFIFEMTAEQILRLTDMKVVDDTTIDETPSEPEATNLDGLDEIVFEGDAEKSKYIREDSTKFNPFGEDWLKDNMDEIDERLKNRDSSDVPADSFEEWRKNFLSKTAKPAPPVIQVDYMKYEKDRPQGRILSWMFVKEIHCVAVKREHGIQYFKSLLSILTLPLYDVAALARLELINRLNFEGAKLFARKLGIERRKGWKDELYKPQFPMYEQIKFTLDPATNTPRYRLMSKPVKVLDKIPLMPMEQDILANMTLWCYDSDTHEAFIVFRNDKQNFRILDPMWIVNMLVADIDRLFRQDIFYEDKDVSQALRFQRVASLCYYRRIHAGSSWSEVAH